MFCYNDSWPVNDASLAFYMSTNTFSNPIFEHAQLEQENTNQANKGQLSDTKNVDSKTRRKNGNDSATRSNTSSSSSSSHPSAGKTASRWTTLCDGLIFSVKSKIFVLELNFKRELRRFKRFTSDHLPCFLLRNKRRNPLSGARNKFFSGGQLNSSSSASITLQTNSIKDEFWKEVEELSSRKTLEKQQEKVLYRLEKVLQVIRGEQQLQAQMEKEQPGDESDDAGDDQFFNRNEANSSRMKPNGLTVESIKYPSEIIVQKPIMMSSGLRSLSSSSSFCSQISSSQSSRSFENGNRAIRASKRKARWIGKVPATKRHVRNVSSLDDSGDSPSKKLCIICYTNSPNIVTLPCKHHDICSDCFIEVIYMAVKRSQYPLKCVLCRQKVEKIRCSRRLLLSVIGKNRIRP